MTLLTRLARPILLIVAISSAAQANPYVAKPGERSLTLRIVTCAVSGGFVHLYTAIDNKLFSKYGLNFEHIYIQASAPSLAPWQPTRFSFSIAPPTRPCRPWHRESAGKNSPVHWWRSPLYCFLGKNQTGSRSA